MALAVESKLLLLDEPTAGLSPVETREAVAVLTDIAKSEGFTVLFVEHDMDVVFKYSDRIVVMAQGAIMAQGTPDEIRNNEQVAMTLLGSADTSAFTRKD